MPSPEHSRKLITPQFNAMAGLIKESYDRKSLSDIEKLLGRHETLGFKIKPNGLYAALTTDKIDAVSGYTYTWVRDSVMVSHFQLETGRPDIAAKTMQALETFFEKHKSRFDNIISGKASKEDVMERPHIRFNGDTLDEVRQKWAHAENDALGYALWLTFKLANEGHLQMSSANRGLWARFPAYLEAIAYWNDPDSGHWEEARKVESSSIGPVVAGLEQMKTYMQKHPEAEFSYDGKPATVAQLDGLIAQGRKQLDAFLPWETPGVRKADAATLFLIYPLNVVGEKQADAILDTVLTDLMGDYGIKRYLGDSYWGADYKTLMAEADLTADFSDNMEERDKKLIPNTEAQWNLFDPMVSVVYGRRYLKSGDPQDLEKQTYFFNRSLTQLTGDNAPVGPGKCAEAHYMEDSKTGAYVPNDNMPLAWTQANLGTALDYMKRSLEKQAAGGVRTSPKPPHKPQR